MTLLYVPSRSCVLKYALLRTFQYTAFGLVPLATISVVLHEFFGVGDFSSGEIIRAILAISSILVFLKLIVAAAVPSLLSYQLEINDDSISYTEFDSTITIPWNDVIHTELGYKKYLAIKSRSKDKILIDFRQFSRDDIHLIKEVIQKMTGIQRVGSISDGKE